MNNMNDRFYQCPKCGCTEYENDEFCATGSGFSKLFDIQNRKFITISCKNCGYTELYKGKVSRGMNILDYLMG